MSLEILRKIGLSEGEIKVYSALLDLGRSPINKIHERTGIERRNIYDIINKLIEKGLVSYITENKKRVYNISHPNKIIGYIEEKKNELENTKEAIEKELPSIIGKFNLAKTGTNGELFRGAEGNKSVWDDMLNYPEIRWLGSGRYIPKRYPLWFSNWNRKRVKAKVKVLNLMRHELRKEIEHPFELEQLKYLPKEFSVNPTVIGIFGNKVGNFIFGDEIFVFVIENKELAENYRRYHKYLWENVAKL